MRRVLIVDDNADNRYSLRLLLDEYEVIEASGGEEAIDVATAERPDCILLDVQMPGMDGFEVCRRLRAGPATESLPIILVTAHHRDTESVVRGLAAGGDDYLTKPVEPAELKARIRAMLRIHDLQTELEKFNTRLGREVRRRTAELQQVYDTVPVGIYTLDATGHVTSFNRHLEELLGFGEEEMLGRSIGELFQDDYDTLYWLEVARREGRAAGEARARCKDGRRIPVYDERVVRHDPVGEHVGFTGYMQDLSQRQRLRAILKEQETQAAVGRLAAGIVHEIANPVSGVQQYLDALVRRFEQSESREAHGMRKGAQVMRDALDRTTELIRNLRGFTRSAVRPVAAVDPRPLIDDLGHLLRYDLHRRKISFVVDVVETDHLTIQGDAGRLTQVFLNLITNARDAMPDGGALTVELRAEDSNVVLRFRDTGTGIAGDNIGKLFDFLFTTKGEAGTGYGLTISREIVEEHGGRIEVESELGEGTVFTVILPRSASGPLIA